MAEVDVNLKSPIATIIGAVGSAIGGIGNAVGGASKLAGNSIETIGNIAKAGSATGGDAPDRTVNESNLGLVAAAAQQSVKGKGGSGTLPARKTATKQKPSQNLSTEKLLSIAVKHLSSIDASLKAQMDYNVQATREEAKQEKENDIEGKNSVFTRFADRMKMKASNAAGAAKEKGMGFAQSAAMVAAAALVLKLSTLKPETIEKLKTTIDEFQKTWGPVFEFVGGLWLGYKTYGAANWLWQLFNKDKSLAGWALQVSKKIGLTAWASALEMAGGSAVVAGIAAVGATSMTIGQLALVDWIIKEAHKDPEAALIKLQKEYGLERVEGGWKIKGKVYPGGSVPQRYQDIIDVSLGLRGKAVDDARARIEANKADYTRENLENQYLPNVDEDGRYREPVPDATKVGTIPDVAYNIGWNNLKDLAPPKPITQMTVDEVIAYQEKLFAAGKKKNGEGHTGVGAFAIQVAGLREAKQKGAIKGSDKFDRIGQEKVGTYIWNSRKGMSMAKTWVYTGQHPEKGYWDNQTFEQNKYNIALNEVGSYAGMTGHTALANATGDTLTALGKTRETIANALAEQDKKLTRRNPNGEDTLTKQMAVDQKANVIRQQAVALENSMRGDAKKEQDRKDAADRMTPGAKLAKANQGKMEALDPNYKTDSNNIISKYFVYFGLAA